jgi:hypothetical protein
LSVYEAADKVKRSWKMVSNRCIATVVFAGIACAGSAYAQLDEPKRDVVFQTADVLPPPGAGVATFKYIGAEAMIPGKVVKGAPYSATAVTETVQTLADGNRITSTISSFLARDSEGRTRREQSLPALGPWASQGPAPKLVNISDPVSGNTYMLDDQAKTANRLRNVEPMGAAEGNVHYQRVVRIQAQSAPAAGTGQVVMIQHAGAVGMNAEPGSESKQENLGQTTVEGIMANGVRSTTVVPAGAMGNERPITITDEKWYSPELQTTVLSKHSDPRMGETTFRLTNISRSEPPASLFQVPPDYQIVDASKGPVEVHIEKH